MSREMETETLKLPNWREQIAKNQARTRWVIAMFFLIYLSVGFVFDLVLYTHAYPLASLDQVIFALLHGELFPIISCVMLSFAALALWVTYHFYDKLMLLGTEYTEITPESARGLQEKQLYNTVEELKIAAGLQYMPKVFVIDADYMNAFASGYSEKSAMVAITRGLLEKLDRSELQAVMAHELSHIRHLDIKLTMTAAVLSNIMLIALDLVFYNMLYARPGGDREKRGGAQGIFVVVSLLRFVLPIITLFLMMYLSRTREYMADAGCVELMRDNEPLARALMKIHQDHEQHAASYGAAYQQTAHEELRQAAYLYDPRAAGIGGGGHLTSLFSTHPSLADRLKALGVSIKP